MGGPARQRCRLFLCKNILIEVTICSDSSFNLYFEEEETATNSQMYIISVPLQSTMNPLKSDKVKQGGWKYQVGFLILTFFEIMCESCACINLDVLSVPEAQANIRTLQLPQPGAPTTVSVKPLRHSEIHSVEQPSCTHTQRALQPTRATMVQTR